jgi:ribosome maturation factor RimP
MLEIHEVLKQYVEGALELHPGLFLLTSEYRDKEGKHLFIVDGLTPFTIQQCGQVSRYVMKRIEENPELEEERAHFSFEVASPGAEKPLMDARQYPKHTGRKVNVFIKGRELPVTGTLMEVGSGTLTLQELIPSKIKGRKDKEGEVMNIPFETITETKIILSFN